MTFWQTDIVDTQRKALVTLEKLLELYDQSTILEADGLVTCHRSREKYAQPMRSIWPWAD